MAKETTVIDSDVLKELIESIDKIKTILQKCQNCEIDDIVTAFQNLPYSIDIRVSKEDWDWTSSASSSSCETHISSDLPLQKRAENVQKELRRPHINMCITQAKLSIWRMILKSWIVRMLGVGFLVYLAWITGLFVVGKAIPVNEYEMRHSES